MIKASKFSHALLSVIWLAVVLSLAIYSYRSFFVQEKLQFDILALLPENKSQTMTSVAEFMEDTKFSNRLLILVGHPDPVRAKDAFHKVGTLFSDNPLAFTQEDASKTFQNYKQFFESLYPYRAGLLSRKDRDHLLRGQADFIVKRAIAEIMLPFSPAGPIKIKTDPFLLYPTFIKSLQPSFKVQIDENGDPFLTVNGTVWYIFKATLKESAFSLQILEQISSSILPALTKIQQDDGVKILKVGAVFYAAAGSQQANTEIAWIGLISAIGIILMILAVFQSIRPLIFALSVITSGIVCGISACFFVFGSVHILALVFGCTLAGVTVDYALHYFCASYTASPFKSADCPQRRFDILKNLLPALPLSVLSSVVGYGLLLFVPFPGVQQMALLASIGLIAAFLSVCLWGPYLVGPSLQNMTVLGKKIQNSLERIVTLGRRKQTKKIVSITLLIIGGVGCCLLQFEDDVRHFQPLNLSLKQEENDLKSLMKMDNSSKFLLISGQTAEEVLQKSEKVAVSLENSLRNGEISSYKSLADLIPSQERQQQNRHLIQSHLYQEEWAFFTHTLKIPSAVNPELLGLNAPFFKLGNSLGSELIEGWRELICLSEGELVKGRILLEGVKDDKVIHELIKDQIGIYYINPVAEYSKLFTYYRHLFIGLILSIFMGITVFLFLYHGRKVMQAIVPPIALSILGSIGIIGLCQIPFTLFHALGFLLVLGIGIDYALFLYWTHFVNQPPEKEGFSLLANALAAATTLLSFGLLSFSQTAAVRDFGVAIFPGILLCFSVTALFLGKKDA